jgi:hypothetical protein
MLFFQLDRQKSTKKWLLDQYGNPDDQTKPQLMFIQEGAFSLARGSEPLGSVANGNRFDYQQGTEVVILRQRRDGFTFSPSAQLMTIQCLRYGPVVVGFANEANEAEPVAIVGLDCQRMLTGEKPVK